ncbi:hypothetical protein QAD02_004634 [Eretmocerus hayati]|uniref:Uncharacterized protein n=1 Tax=Eretmocerus hayati TaxID=131215 RepID=A0ACC2NQH8_9HYME|nr:hypothetical protein QAD02_004634 [Eretmocerus hayati]
MMSAVPTTSQGISVVESDSYPSVCVLSTVRTSEPTTDKSHDDQQLNSLLPENPDPETEFLIDSFDANDLIDDFDYAYRYSDGEDSGYSDDEDSPPDDNTKYEDEEKFLVSIEENRNDPVEICDSISKSLKGVLTHWSIESNISQNAMAKLLHKIRDEVPNLKLPLQARSLYDFNVNDNPVQQLAGGHYLHFILMKCVEKIIQKRLSIGMKGKFIKILVGIDGAPLGKSSEKNMWPILISDQEETDVYIAGIYVGDSKPTDANEFLQQFVDECIPLLENGLVVEEEVFNFSITLVCDTPAKAFVLVVKYHTGRDSCTKCIIEGVWNGKTICFPGDIFGLRTDEEFRAFAYSDDYQHDLTILARIRKFGPVTHVPLDVIHLVYLGVTKKFFLILMKAKTPHKLPAWKIKQLSGIFVELRRFIPYEFARKPRKLEKKLLQKFVADFALLFGDYFVTFNVHNLLHLVDDVRLYGLLESFSAFRFENFMFLLKNRIRKESKNCAEPELSCKHNSGPITHPSVEVVSQHKCMKLKNFKVNCADGKNGCLMVDGKVVIDALNFVKTSDGSIHVVGKVFKIRGDVFDLPCKSSKLGIVVLDKPEEAMYSWNINRISGKMMKLPYKRDYAALPILHTLVTSIGHIDSNE